MFFKATLLHPVSIQKDRGQCECRKLSKLSEWGCEQFVDDVGEVSWVHRLNMESDLSKFIWAPCAQL
jgi:hypothetical protein